jgi:LytS/YehU family sensor histidine kinase
MDLQQLRKDDKYSVHFSCSPEVRNFNIAPLLLIPFVENAFKHISHFNNKSNFVKVDLARANGVFRFSVENSKEEQRRTEKGGIGMNNVKRRLELLYPGKHELTIQETTDHFSVKLNLELS